MSNVFTRFVNGELMEAPAPLPEGDDWCSKCGVRVKPEFLQYILTGETTLLKDGNVSPPSFVTNQYCRECKPPAALQLKLMNTEGYELDELLFRVEDGWFQHVDGNTNEDQYLISLEEYNHTICENCGELVSEETKCKSCLSKEAAKRDKKASK